MTALVGELHSSWGSVKPTDDIDGPENDSTGRDPKSGARLRCLQSLTRARPAIFRRARSDLPTEWPMKSDRHRRPSTDAAPDRVNQDAALLASGRIGVRSIAEL